MLTTRPRGTNDILPREAEKWRYVESVIHEVCRVYGYGEIRTPVFEHTELVERGAGETSDIVTKQMYTFRDRGGRSITLRPEGTAPTIRAYLEHKLYAEPQPIKLYYIAPIFRYERPQAGRFRQHHQFGVELLGAGDPASDAEVICLALELFRRLGLRGLSVKLNSIGCPRCRPKYREALLGYARSHLSELCSDCIARYAANPLRILDCKEEACREAVAGAPDMLEWLCEECISHFAGLKAHLAALGVEYRLDRKLVRGLDYYTRTVFEIDHGGLGALTAVCGGGRYDGLVEELGGEPTPGIGFGLGLERLILTLDKEGLGIPAGRDVRVYIATVGDRAMARAVELVRELRGRGIACEMDYLGRSLKAQFKHADRLEADWVAILGDDELEMDAATLRDMRTGDQRMVKLSELAAAVGGNP